MNNLNIKKDTQIIIVVRNPTGESEYKAQFIQPKNMPLSDVVVIYQVDQSDDRRIDTTTIQNELLSMGCFSDNRKKTFKFYYDFDRIKRIFDDIVQKYGGKIEYPEFEENLKKRKRYSSDSDSDKMDVDEDIFIDENANKPAKKRQYRRIDEDDDVDGEDIEREPPAKRQKPNPKVTLPEKTIQKSVPKPKYYNAQIQKCVLEAVNKLLGKNSRNNNRISMKNRINRIYDDSLSASSDDDDFVVPDDVIEYDSDSSDEIDSDEDRM